MTIFASMALAAGMFLFCIACLNAGKYVQSSANTGVAAERKISAKSPVDWRDIVLVMRMPFPCIDMLPNNSLRSFKLERFWGDEAGHDRQCADGDQTKPPSIPTTFDLIGFGSFVQGVVGG